MIYITGHTHRDFSRLNNIVLVDAGINYCLNNEDIRYKNYICSENQKNVIVKTT